MARQYSFNNFWNTHTETESIWLRPNVAQLQFPINKWRQLLCSCYDNPAVFLRLPTVLHSPTYQLKCQSWCHSYYNNTKGSWCYGLDLWNFSFVFIIFIFTFSSTTGNYCQLFICFAVFLLMILFSLSILYYTLSVCVLLLRFLFTCVFVYFLHGSNSMTALHSSAKRTNGGCLTDRQADLVWLHHKNNN